MKTIIVGGGFGGVKAALELSKRNVGKVTLISDEPFFLHHATLYATATGRATEESVVSLDDIFKPHPNVTVVHDTMKSIEAERRLVIGHKKSYKYDNLIIAIGVVTTYFGINGLDKHSFGIKTLGEVKDFKNHLHSELAADKHLDKNYVVIGAGPTGVELAGALKGYLERIAASHQIKRAKVNITLVEAAPRILPRMSKTASKKVEKQLQKMGIKVLLGRKVEALDDDYVVIDGKKVPTQTAVWTSGVTNHPFFSRHTDLFNLAPNGRVEVNRYLEAAPHIYVIGDNAFTKNTGVARTALGDAIFVADHLARLQTNRPLKTYHTIKPPSGVPIGENWAYVEWFGVYVSSRSGYVVRRMMELFGYLSLLPWPQAVSAWRAHRVFEEDCPICRETNNNVVKT